MSTAQPAISIAIKGMASSRPTTIKVEIVSSDTGLRQRDRFLRVRLAPKLVAVISCFCQRDSFE